MEKWIYYRDSKNKCRYSLGIHGKNMLICCGVNPSTAKPNDLDNTVRRVDGFARDNNYDGYIMINLYPQISTNPKGIHKRINNSYHRENIEHLEEIFRKYPGADIWGAWGVLIESRKFFKRSLKDIYKLSKKYDLNWVHFNKLTKAGHPRHPLYLRADSKKYSFDINSYIKKLSI